eukprot:TRINITY_DN13988_c0_g2_i1.p1 TRINITY_DN13988_c0_g2~~TRINITY_DN13988_c0_g2_i1.p1  ORF type:complete len:420 (+),score=39.59 TRINITY_DN13988_c0_g2_i1:141-1400(+)
MGDLCLVSNTHYELCEDRGKPAATKQVSSFGAFVILVKINWGIGMISMPFFLHSAGLWSGIFFFCTAMGLAFDSVLQLGRCKLCIPRCAQITSYTSLMRTLLGRRGGACANFSVMLAMWGSAAAWMKFCADNLEQFLPETGLDNHLWGMVVLAAVLPCAFIDNVSALRHVSTFGLIASQGVACIMVAWAVNYRAEFPSYVAAQPVIRWSSFPVAMGLAVFCNEGMVVIAPSVVASMQQPQAFSRSAFAMILYFTVNYMAVAVAGDFVFGFLAGHAVEQEVSLSFDLTLLQRSAVLMYILQLILTFPCCLIALFHCVETSILQKSSGAARRVMRIIAIFIAFFVGMWVPHFGDFIAVTGGLGNSLGTYILPNVATLVMDARGELTVGMWRRIACYTIIAVIGVGCGSIATAVSLAELLRT